MKIKIKKLNPNAKVPTQANPGDFCYDVYATSCRKIGHRTWEYGLGLAFQIEREDIVSGFETIGVIEKNGNIYEEAAIQNYSFSVGSYRNVKLSIDFRPRSSIWKTGLVLSNCCGTIDELYRGEVKAVFYHVNSFKKKYKVGDRIGQIKLGFTLPFEFEVVDELDMNTKRGTGGFGSSGR